MINNWPAHMCSSFHVNNSSRFEVKITEECDAQINGTSRYRILGVICEYNEIHMFLTTEQAEKLAIRIMAQLESEKREAKVG